MFKLESYVTPLILSYVDKYIKNLKPEDSQLSLWGGDAVFTNLDLRLDVLEQELNLPFSFINGHIHELRIHVPWTRLGSEPVVITINTIECILKLRDEDDSGSDGSSKSSLSSAAQKNRHDSVSRKRLRRQEGEEVPPSYVQSLINRVLNNISVVCNNLILKYVEDDIVLSLNIKSAEFFSVDESWERSFSDLNPECPVLRKVISMQDLTVCLDKRDASGKIEMYQDPLLYRCSATCRIYMRYDNPHATTRSITRIHLFCDSLDFSITDQQLPMFLRLVQLCLALYYNEFGETSKPKRNSQDLSVDESGNSDQLEIMPGGEVVASGDAGWGSWVWSYVPQILPDWAEDEMPYNTGESSKYSSLPHIFQFGVFVDKATCIFKLTESFRETPSYFGQSKLSFQPMAAFYLSGAAVEITIKNADFVHVQMGVTSVSLATMGECICGIAPFNEAQIDKQDIIFKSGSLLMDNPVMNFHASSLFDPHAPENVSEQREYIFDWEKHLSRWTEKALLHKYPALAIDYIYELEIPEEWSDRASSITATFLENSNWHERAFLRMIFGQSITDITSSFVHRLEKFFHCAQQHEYPPYASENIENGDKMQTLPTLEDLESLEEFVPSRTYQLTLVKPMLRIHISNHPVIDVSKHQITERKKRKKHKSKQGFSASLSASTPPETPVLTLFGDCVSMQISKPMYAQRLIRIASAIATPPSNLLHHCHIHLSLKLFGFEIFLSTTSHIYMEGLSVLPPCSIAFFKKSLLFPGSWQSHHNQILEESWAEIPKISLHLTKPQLLTLVMLGKSWWENKPIQQDVVSVLTKDMVDKEKPVLSFELSGLDWHRVENTNVIGCCGSVIGVTCSIHCKNQKVILLHAPECNSAVQKTSLIKNIHDTGSIQSSLQFSKTPSENWLEFTVQHLKDHTVTSDPSVLLVQLQYSAMCLDLSLMTWLSYQPQANLFSVNTVFKQSDIEAKDINGDNTSTTTPSYGQTASQSYSIPLSPLASTWEKMKTSTDTNSDCNSQWATYLFYHSRLFIIQVHIHGCSLLMPSMAWAVPFTGTVGSCASLLPYWQKAIANGSLTEAVIVCLPNIKVSSSGSKNNDLPTKPDLPIQNLEGWNAGAEKFPWNISLQEGSIYTLHVNGKEYNTYYILKPTTVSSTLGVTCKCSVATAELSQLGVCIHTDFQPLFVRCSQKQVSLLMDNLIHLLGSVHSIRKTLHFIHNLGESSPIVASNVVPAPILSVIPNQFSHTSSSQIEVGHDFVSEMPDTTEQITIQQGPATKTKVTLWLQVTLPKLGLSLLAEENKEKIKIEMEIEDFMTSLDVQEVYSKVKAKFNSMNIHCFQKRDKESHWIRAPAEGIIFSCGQKLTPNIFIARPKSPSPHSPSAIPSDARTKSNDSFSHAFLTFTYTRALVTNVQKKWAAFVKEHTPSSGEDDPTQSAEEKQTLGCPEKYISEIELKINSFDIVLLCPVVRIVYNIFLPLQNVYILLSQRKWQSVAATVPLPKLWSFNHNNLPLIYLNTSSIRIFVPEVHPLAENFEGKQSDRSQSKDRRRSDSPDTCILQIGSIMLVPQAENPLSRIVLRRDLYLAAQRSRTIGIPGAAIEDRQYQLDVLSFSFSTALWHDIVHQSRERLHSPPPQLSTLGENPALEWNNKVFQEEKGSEEDEIVSAVPVMSQFDMRVLVAPAVVYKKQLEHQRKLPEEILVCGHSVEVNVTTDFGVYLSLHQLQLIHKLWTKNLMEIFTVPERESMSLEDGFSHLIPRASLSDLIRDSGIDSEDTATRLVSQSPLALFSLKPGFPASNERKSQAFVPFELLVTGCSVSLTVYHDDLSLVPTKRSMCRGKVMKKKIYRRSQNYPHPSSPVQDSEEQVEHVNLSKYFSKSPKSQKKKKQRILRQKDDASSQSSQECNAKSLETSSTCTFTGLFSEEDGYDGSEDSCSEVEVRHKEKDRSGSESKSLHPGHSRIIPCVYVCISQPHTFVSCHPSKQKIETSCFDVQVKGAHYSSLEDIPILPSPTDFTTSWILTRPGEVHPKTGIPPALVTLTLGDFLHRPANIKLQLERPVKVSVNTLMLEQLQSLYNTTCLLLHSESNRDAKSTSSGSVDAMTATQEATSDESHSSIKRYIETLKSTLKNASKLELNCVQSVLSFESSFEYGSIRLHLSTNSTKGEISIIPEASGDVQDVNMNLNVQGLFLKVGTSDHMQRFVGPFSFEVISKASWESWHTCSPLPQTQMRINGEVLYINLNPDQLKYFELLQKQIQDILLESKDQDKEKNPPESHSQKKHKTSKVKPKDFHSQEFVDDLRKGTFQYIQDNDGSGIQPKPYDIVFCKEQGTMTWCYPQPRALTRVDVFPVPYHPSSINSFSSSEVKSPPVQCSLQYWNVMKNCFVTCSQFYLSESSSTSLEMPLVSRDTCHLLAVSELWRVVLNCKFGDFVLEDTDPSDVGVLSPMALAACMKIDSCFNPTLLPNFQTSVNISLCQVTFGGKLHGKATPLRLRPFTLDDRLPHEQEFGHFTLDNPSISFQAWHKKWKGEVTLNIGCELMEYRCLTMHPVIEPVDIQGNVIFSNNSHKTPVLDVAVMVHPLFLKVNQSMLHTLNIISQAWLQSQKEDETLIIPQHYIICNNSDQTFCFGQVGTDESIVLISRQMHAYSWRSHKAVQMIHVSLRVMGQKWCEPFPIDSPGTFTRAVSHRGVCSNLVIRVVQLSSVQFQVIVFGQFLLCNQLTQNLEVQLLARRVLKPFKVLTLVEPLSTLPGFIVDFSRIIAIRVRLQGIDMPWSEDVAITGDGTQQPQLVKIPLKGSNQYLSSWCEFSIKKISENMSYCIVTFSPPFIVRNHLPRTLLAHLTVSEEKESYCIEVSGKGQDHQLVTLGNPAITHKLCFQMGPGMKMSSPPIELSINLIKQIEKEHPALDVAENDASDLHTQMGSAQSFCWPYDDDDIIKDVHELKKQGLLMYDNITKPINAVVKPELPDVELKVNLTLWRSHSNTLLIDVKPSALLINRTGSDLYLVETSGREWKIPNGSTFTPPNLQEIFYLGVIWSSELYLSDPLQSSDDDWTVYHSHPKVKGILPRVGQSNVHIFIKHKNSHMMCCLIINSKEEEGIRIVTVFPTFCLANHTGKGDLNVILSAVPQGSHKTQMSTTSHSILKSKICAGSAVQPLLFWDIIPNDKMSDLDSLMEFNHYIQFSSKSASEACSSSFSKLSSFPISQPVCLSHQSSGSDLSDQRHTVSVPYLKSLDQSRQTWCSEPLVLTQHLRNGVKFLTASVDPYPMLKIYNATNCTLLFGESVEHSEKGITVFEEKGWHGYLPCTPPHSEAYYSFPSLGLKFSNGLDNIPLIHLAQQPLKSDPDYELIDFWSVPVDTRSMNDQFIYIPDAGDVKIHKERVGHTLHVFVDPVSRVEVSAKEIRSRIGTSTRSYTPSSIVCEGTVETRHHDDPEVAEDALVSISTPAKSLPSRKKSKDHLNVTEVATDIVDSLVIYSSVTFSHVCVIICDSTKLPAVSEEILRINLDNILLNFRPGPLDFHVGRVIYDGIYHTQHEFTICIGNLQIDNQMSAEQSGFDFQVILTQQQDPSATKLESSDSLHEMSSSFWLSKAKHCSTITTEVILESVVSKPEYKRYWVINKFNVTVQPLSFFLEDIFCYNISALRTSLFPHQLHKQLKLQVVDLFLPDDVSAIAKTLVHPIRIQHFYIAPLSMLVSLHASLKIYLSLDNSPLDFMAYEQNEVFITSYRFGQQLTIHYLSGALLRAGWVVGSLDLIGNPTGLVRAISSGISDFFFLPYSGLFRGPRAFVMGIAHGTVSLLRQISSGTLRSLTNLATSVSRNMDRLSLDTDHWSRQEELRRQLPQGITSGLVQGLSSFGISLLGAVAGIVDQPLRTLVSQTEGDTTGLRATELVAGVGKGLVGVVTKPIGGAAEFVSQTGHGLLHGAGWGRKLSPRYKSASLLLSDNCSSHQRLMSKVFYGLSSSEALMCIEVNCQNSAGVFVTNILFLTPDVLCVASKSEDIHQQTFLVTEVNCYGSDSDKSLIYLVSKQKPGSLPLEEHDEAKDRIADYIQQYSGSSGWAAKSEALDEHGSPPEGQTFFVHPKLRNTFIMLFDMAQKRAQGRGFAV